MTPGEAVVRVQQAELQQAKSNGLALRKQLEAVSKELAVCKQQLHATQKALHNAELAKGTHQEYSRHMEQQLERSGKGVALLKAAKLQSELEFLQKENGVLFSDLQTKGLEVKSLLDELSHQRDLVDHAARGVGLPSRQLLEELVELRQQVSSMSDNLLEKDAIVKRQEMDLQDFHLYRGQYKQLEGRASELEAALGAAEADKATLLDFIQDMQAAEARHVSERDGSLAAEAAAKERETSAQAKVDDLQQLVKEQLGLLHASQTSCTKLEKEGQALRQQLAQATEECAQAQAQHQATTRQQAAVAQELKRMQETLQGVLDPSEAQHVQLDGAINAHTHRVMAAAGPAASPARSTPGTKARTTATAAAAVPGTSQMVTSLACVSRQLDALVAQHTRLQQAWQKAGSMQKEADKLRQQLLDQESLLAAAAGRQSQLESELAAGDAQWRRLSGTLRDAAADAARPTEAHVPGREQELVSAVEARLHAGRQALSTALSNVSVAREETAGLRATLVTLEAERTGLKTRLAAADEECESRKGQLRTLREELQKTKAALGARPSEEDLDGLRSHVTALQKQLDSAHHQTDTLMSSHEAELRNAERSHAATRTETASLGAQLQQSRMECEKLTLRVAAAQEALVQQEEDLLRYKALHVKHMIRSPLPHAPLSTQGQGSMAGLLAAAAVDARAQAVGERRRLAALIGTGTEQARWKAAHSSSDEEGGTDYQVHAGRQAPPSAPWAGKTDAWPLPAQFPDRQEEGALHGGVGSTRGGGVGREGNVGVEAGAGLQRRDGGVGRPHQDGKADVSGAQREGPADRARRDGTARCQHDSDGLVQGKEGYGDGSYGAGEGGIGTGVASSSSMGRSTQGSGGTQAGDRVVPEELAQRERLRAAMHQVSSLTARATSHGAHVPHGHRHVAAGVQHAGTAVTGGQQHTGSGMQSSKERLDALTASYKQLRRHMA